MYSLREVNGIPGWIVAFISVICVPIHAAKVLLRGKGNFIKRIRDSCKPSKNWGPVEPVIREQWKAFQNLHNVSDIPLNVTK